MTLLGRWGEVVTGVGGVLGGASSVSWAHKRDEWGTVPGTRGRWMAVVEMSWGEYFMTGFRLAD